MKTTKKDTILNSAVLFAAWLVIIIAAVSPSAPTEVVRIAYQTE